MDPSGLIVIRGDQEEKFIFTPENRPVFFFQGAFSPPHKGHWQQIEWMFQMHPNARVIINQLGERHNFPEQTVRRVFQTYVKEYVYSEKISLLYRKSQFRISHKHPFMRDASHFIIYRSYEPHKHFHLEKTKTYQASQQIAIRLQKNNIQTLLFMAKRIQFTTGSTLSSTQFSSSLQHSLSESKKKELYCFLPDHLRNKQVVLQMLLSSNRLSSITSSFF